MSTDGPAVSHLISRCPPLDTNSPYCNLLQCTHFSSTSIAAVRDSKLIGFVSGYLLPQNPDTLFIWQVAVDETARGLGLASSMIAGILVRSHCAGVNWLETTVTADNDASWRLFEGIASKRNAQTSRKIHFDQKAHFDGNHDSEYLMRIGPLNTPQSRVSNTDTQ